MHGNCSFSSSSVSRYCGAVETRSHLEPNDTEPDEPQRLHDINQELWQRSFQSVMTNAHGESPTINLSFDLNVNSLPTFTPGFRPQAREARVGLNSNTSSHYNSSSPPEPTNTGPEFQSSPTQDATPTQVQSPRRSGSRPFSCPDCHTYTTNRKYNLNRHRETRHGKRRHSN